MAVVLPDGLIVKLILGLILLIEVTSTSNTPVRLSISSTNSDLKFGQSKSHLRWPEGATLNLTCSVQIFDADRNSYVNLGGKSPPSYEMDWYLPNVYKYIHDGKINDKTISLPDTRSTHSGLYECRATILEPKGGGDSFPSLMKKELDVHIVGDSEGRPKSCGGHFFQCHTTQHCIPRRYTCDGVSDCLDESDESVPVCGENPCEAKLRCEDHRCMDPSVCCDPNLDPSCNVLRDCCIPIIETGRQFYKLGIEKRKSQDLEFLHSTVTVIIGCVVSFIVLMSGVAFTICRLHAKRGWSWRYAFGGNFHGSRNARGGGRAHPPLTAHDLDLYFSSLRRVENAGITYNINNGVQIMGGPHLPPPYSAAIQHDPRHPINEPPPPYNIVVEQHNAEQDPELNHPLLVNDDENNNNEVDAEDNNNGDINGNSDMVDHNLEHQRLQQQLLEDQVVQPLEANVEVLPVHNAFQQRPNSPLILHRASNIGTGPVGWQPVAAASVSVPGVQQAIITTARSVVYRDEYSSSDSE